MNHICRYGTIVLGVMTLLTGCSKDAVEKEKTITKAKTEVNTEAAAKMEVTTDEAFFPSSYTGGTEKVKFDFTLEIPEEFDPLNFYIPKINGLQYIDQNTAYDKYVKDKEIQEQYIYPNDENNPTEQKTYIFPDGKIIGLDTGFYYWEEVCSYYVQAARPTEKGASQEQFSFDSAEECINKVKSTLSEMAYPVDEFKFSWFSMNSKEYQNLEQENIANKSIEIDKAKESWTDADNVYEIYAWQIYGGLPVFPQQMTVRMGRAFESYQKAPLSGEYSEKGMLSLVAQAPYIFEKTNEVATFLTFPEIVSVVEKKYDNLLDDVVYNVNRAQLAIRIYFDETQKYAATPIWYFEVADDNGNTVVVLVNALSGEEIFLE